MQRQAVPSTLHCWNEHGGPRSSGLWRLICAEFAGGVTEVDAAHVVIYSDEHDSQRYDLPKYERSNQSTCINRQLSQLDQKVEEPGQYRRSICPGTLSWREFTVAPMPWEGYNYGDSIIVSEARCSGRPSDLR